MIKTSLTSKQPCVHIGVFAQQLLAHVNSWIVLILNAQQDLILQHTDGSNKREHGVAAGEGANRIAKWGSHMVVGTNWWEVMWAQWADHWEQSNLGVGVVGLFAMATKVGGVVSLTLG